MKKAKRYPLRRMILIIVLSIAAVSLTVMSAVGIVSMAKIKEKSENALTEQAMTNLSEVIDKKTAVQAFCQNKAGTEFLPETYRQNQSSLGIQSLVIFTLEH